LIEQALYGTEGRDGYHFLARSPGFLDDWLPEAERLCTSFGERPAGVSCPGCVFALPFSPVFLGRLIAVVAVADQGRDDAGRPGAMCFRLLILPQTLYAVLGGDPFRIAETFPPPWRERGELPVLEWPGPFEPRRRTVEQIQKVLDVSYSATLLGGVQALVDGGRLVFERTEPEPNLLRSLWALLPTATRSELWPASFAFSNAHGFHVVVVPRASGPDYENMVHEAQAGDYPEGRYELALQSAAESGDQHELNRLFGRRSRSQTLHLALVLLALFIGVPILGTILAPLLALLGLTPPARPSAEVPGPKLELPPVSACPPLEGWERKKLAEVLTVMGTRQQLPPPTDDSPGGLLLALEALDSDLGTPDSRRDPGRRGRTLLAVSALTLPATVGPLGTGLVVTFGPTGQLRDQGPLQRGLRTLLWKHAVPESSEAKLNTVELAERLEGKLKSGGRNQD